MPGPALPAVAAPLIGKAVAGPLIAGALTGGLNIASGLFTGKANRKSEREARRWNEKMWHLQNAYNHPSQQMARLQEAGLNPRLIYGGSPSGASGSAGAVAPGKAERYDYSVGDPISAFQNTRMITAQTQNLQAMRDLNEARALDTLNNAGISGINYNAMKKGGEAVLDGIMSKYLIPSAELEKALAEANVAKGTQAARIAQETQKLNNLIKDGTLKDLDQVYKTFVAQLAEQGFTVGDNKWTRLLISQLEKTGAMDQINKFASDVIKDPMAVFAEMLLGNSYVRFRN